MDIVVVGIAGSIFTFEGEKNPGLAILYHI